MAERAVFLDRDDTIIDNDGYLGDPSKVKLLPGAATALAAIRALGYRLIVVSNQSGVARGMFDEAAVQAVNDEMGRQIKEKGGTHIDASYYCPYHPEAKIAEYRIDHDWRKPKAGMLKQAAVDFRLELSQCWMVGDMDRDIAAGAAVGCRTILLRDPERRPDRNEAATVTPNFVVKTLADAARIIAREGKIPPPVLPSGSGSSVPGITGPGSTSQAILPNTPLATQLTYPAASAAPGALPLQPRVAAEPALNGADYSRTEKYEPSSLAPRAAPDRVAPHGHEPHLPADMAPSPLEKNLEDLVILLRQQNRHADLRPDFSLANMAAIILQFLTLAAFGVGFVKLMTQKATFNVPMDYELAVLANLQSIAWIAGAIVLQGIVLALLLHAASKK